MKLIFRQALLFFFLCVHFISVIGQESAYEQRSLPRVNKQYSAQELDSIATSLRQYFYDGNYELVLEIAPSLIKQADSAKMYPQEYRLRSILGNTFSTLDEVEKAYELFTEGLEKAKKKNDTVALLRSYINLGNTFLENDPPKAIGYLENALKLGQGPSSLKNIALFIIHNNLSEIYLKTNKLDLAIHHLSTARAMLDKEDLAPHKKEYLAVLQCNQGGIYLKQKKYYQAILATKEALVFGKNAFAENYLIQSHSNLMSAYESLGQYKKVNDIRHTYDSLMTRKYEAEKIKQQNIAASKYKLDNYKQQLRQSQLEKEITAQQQERSNLVLQVFYIFFAVMLGVLGMLFYARYKRKLLLQDLKLKNQQYLSAKERSERLSKKNMQFLSTISHELRTPLYGIIGLSSVFLKNAKFKEYSEDLNSLKFSADYLLALVNDVLNLNKFSSVAGKKIYKSNFNIVHLIRSIVQNFEFLNKKNNNDVIISIGQDVPSVLFTDRTKLSQILFNLISNASKFTEDGSIEIKVDVLKIKKEKYQLQFKIKDTGKGIPEKDQANIFNEFTQVQNNFEIEGSGLGLPIVNNILHTLNSKLVLESTPQKGSVFSFEIYLEKGTLEDIEKEENVGFDKLKSRSILIVDDNKINQVVTQKVLEQFHMTHDTASNGQEALELAQENDYDAILMDINMPVMNGIEASERIREFNTVIPIIALTATDYEKEKENNLTQHGINHFVVKPYRNEDLLDILLKFIE